MITAHYRMAAAFDSNPSTKTSFHLGGMANGLVTCFVREKCHAGLLKPGVFFCYLCGVIVLMVTAQVSWKMLILRSSEVEAAKTPTYNCGNRARASSPSRQ